MFFGTQCTLHSRRLSYTVGYKGHPDNTSRSCPILSQYGIAGRLMCCRVLLRHLAKLKCSILSFSVLTSGGRRCIQVGANGIDDRRSWGESQRRINTVMQRAFDSAATIHELCVV